MLSRFRRNFKLGRTPPVNSNNNLRSSTDSPLSDLERRTQRQSLLRPRRRQNQTERKEEERGAGKGGGGGGVGGIGKGRGRQEARIQTVKPLSVRFQSDETKEGKTSGRSRLKWCEPFESIDMDRLSKYCSSYEKSFCQHFVEGPNLPRASCSFPVVEKNSAAAAAASAVAAPIQRFAKTKPPERAVAKKSSDCDRQSRPRPVEQRTRNERPIVRILSARKAPGFQSPSCPAAKVVPASGFQNPEPPPRDKTSSERVKVVRLLYSRPLPVPQPRLQPMKRPSRQTMKTLRFLRVPKHNGQGEGGGNLVSSSSLPLQPTDDDDDNKRRRPKFVKRHQVISPSRSFFSEIKSAVDADSLSRQSHRDSAGPDQAKDEGALAETDKTVQDLDAPEPKKNTKETGKEEKKEEQEEREQEETGEKGKNVMAFVRCGVDCSFQRNYSNSGSPYWDDQIQLAVASNPSPSLDSDAFTSKLSSSRNTDVSAARRARGGGGGGGNGETDIVFGSDRLESISPASGFTMSARKSERSEVFSISDLRSETLGVAKNSCKPAPSNSYAPELSVGVDVGASASLASKSSRSFQISRKTSSTPGNIERSRILVRARAPSSELLRFGQTSIPVQATSYVDLQSARSPLAEPEEWRESAERASASRSKEVQTSLSPEFESRTTASRQTADERGCSSRETHSTDRAERSGGEGRGDGVIVPVPRALYARAYRDVEFCSHDGVPCRLIAAVRGTALDEMSRSEGPGCGSNSREVLQQASCHRQLEQLQQHPPAYQSQACCYPRAAHQQQQQLPQPHSFHLQVDRQQSHQNISQVHQQGRSRSGTHSIAAAAAYGVDSARKDSLVNVSYSAGRSQALGDNGQRPNDPRFPTFFCGNSRGFAGTAPGRPNGDYKKDSLANIDSLSDSIQSRYKYLNNVILKRDSPWRLPSTEYLCNFLSRQRRRSDDFVKLYGDAGQLRTIREDHASSQGQTNSWYPEVSTSLLEKFPRSFDNREGLAEYQTSRALHPSPNAYQKSHSLQESLDQRRQRHPSISWDGRAEHVDFPELSAHLGGPANFRFLDRARGRHCQSPPRRNNDDSAWSEDCSVNSLSSSCRAGQCRSPARYGNQQCSHNSSWAERKTRRHSPRARVVVDSQSSPVDDSRAAVRTSPRRQSPRHPSFSCRSHSPLRKTSPKMSSSALFRAATSVTRQFTSTVGGRHPIGRLPQPFAGDFDGDLRKVLIRSLDAARKTRSVDRRQITGGGVTGPYRLGQYGGRSSNSPGRSGSPRQIQAWSKEQPCFSADKFGRFACKMLECSRPHCFGSRRRRSPSPSPPIPLSLSPPYKFAGLVPRAANARRALQVWNWSNHRHRH